MAHSHSHSTHLDADSEDEHFDEQQEKIYAACSLLIQLGFNRKLFTIKNIYKHGYTDDEFLELIKPLASLTYMDEYDLNHLAQSANRCYAKLKPYHFQNFVDFTKWLYEANGKRTLEFLSNKNKNIVRKELTTAEVSVARMFIEYGASRKQERDRIREKIEELSIQQRKLEMEYESIDEELKRKLGPLYEYKEPGINELRIEAYKLYEEDCKSNGISPIPKHRDKGFKKVMELFGDVAKERLQLVSYLNDPVRQQKVRDFFKGKLFRMEHVTDGGETTIVYKFASDLCEEISSGNIVYKHESEVHEENSDGRKATVIYKFEPDMREKISNVPPHPDSKNAPKQKAKRQEQEHKGAAKKMKSVTLV
ncbi:MEI1 protein [Trifolium medium]|uniref:MEI1 protein n=1 Tax=Trifolium medium TaxID=97028 RepID=A0A392MCT0_9FABA|nr:MEI1 protein [Trifolium medium]